MLDTSMEVDFESVRKRRNESSDEDGSTMKRGKASVSRGRGRGRGRGGRSSVAGIELNQSSETVASENDLFSIVKTLRVPIENAVGDWIQEYKSAKEMATIALAQFFVSCCGSKTVVNKGLVLANKYPDIVRIMTEEYDEETGDYPIVTSNPQFKRFRANMCDFVQNLVKRCQHSIIYDQVMMDHVISFLTVLGDSQVRSFRHTSTVAAVKIITALVEIVNNVMQSMESDKRQLDTESFKPQDKKGTEKMDLLKQRLEEAKVNLEELQNMVAYLFKSIFVHRYRDVVPDIRSTCISEMGIWLKAYPQMFLEDSYLKYIGWTLYDKVPEVRLKCLQTLLPLYNSDEIAKRLELFTTKFKTRISTMVLDKDQEVAVNAVNLIIQLSKCYRNVFSHKEAELIYELVYTTNRALATSAGEYLCARLFEPRPLPARRQNKPRSAHTPLLRDLLQFHIDSEFHQHAAYLVDALIDNHEMMKDWACMTDLLLEEPSRDEKPLSEDQERILIEIMACAVKQAATQETPPGRVIHKRPYTTKMEQKQVTDDKAKITEHFIITIPPLLQKFIADPEKLANLVTIPQYFQLEAYTNLRLDKPLDQLLACLASIVDQSTDEEVLLGCARTLEVLCSEHLGIQQRCQTSRAKMLDRIFVGLRQNLTQFWREGREADEEDVAAVASGFKKIAALSRYHDLHHWDVWNISFKCFQPTDDETSILPPEILEKAISSCFLSLTWDLKRLLDTGFDNDLVEQLNSRVLLFLSVCRESLTSESPILRETAFLTACDIFGFFGWQLGERNKVFAPLVVKPTESLEISLASFVADYVFVEAEEEEMNDHTQLEVLHKRRNLLSTFCRQIIHRNIHDKCSAEVYRQYNNFFSDFGDIIKTTITKVRDINKITCARALSCALTSQFTILKEESEDGKVDPQSEGFANLKDLAKKFAACFGNDPMRYREAFAQMHKEGIDFAVHGDRHTLESGDPPPNLDFLEVLSELANKLSKQDKRTVWTYMSRHLTLPQNADDGWQAMFVYRNAMTLGEEMPPPQNVPSSTGTAAATVVHPVAPLPTPGSTMSTIVRRGRGRPARSTVSSMMSGPFVPMVTSTVVRGEGPEPKRVRASSISQLSETGSDEYQEQEIPAPNFSASSYLQQ